MTLQQIATVALLMGMFTTCALERFRVELAAPGGLGIAVLSGLVPFSHVFVGFANSTVITAIEILPVVSVLPRTRAVDAFAGAIGASVHCAESSAAARRSSARALAGLPRCRHKAARLA